MDGIQKTVHEALLQLAKQVEEGNYGDDDRAFQDPDDMAGFVQDIEDDVIGCTH